MLKYLEWLAFLLVAVGVWYISNLDITGQYVMAVSQILWLAVGLQKRMGALIFQSLILFCLAVYAVLNWGANLPGAL